MLFVPAMALTEQQFLINFLSSFHPETALFSLWQRQSAGLFVRRKVPRLKRKLLIFLPQRKIARFQSENLFVGILTFRMATIQNIETNLCNQKKLWPQLSWGL